MGDTHAADLAQLVMTIIMEFLKKEFGTIKWIAHVDNGLIGIAEDDPSILLKVRETLLGMTDTLGLVLNDPETIVPTQSLEYCGINIDLTTKTMQCTEKTAKKASIALKALRQLIGPNGILACPGRLIACSMGLGFYRHACVRDSKGATSLMTTSYNLISAYRSLSKLGEWDSWFEFPPSFTAELIKVLEWVESNDRFTAYDWRGQDEEQFDTISFVDASRIRWGAINVSKLPVEKEMIGYFPNDITARRSVETESTGMMHLTRRLLEAGCKTIAIGTDHISFLGACRKGISPNWRYNDNLKEIRLLLAKHKATLKLFYIPGTLNPADELSRGEHTSLPKQREAVRNTIAQLGKRVATDFVDL
jgi:hypothetical protein